MSYYLKVNFKKVNSELDVFNIIKDIQDYIYDEKNFKHILKENIADFIIWLHYDRIDVSDIKNYKYIEAIKNFILKTFSIKLSYWKNHNLIGVIDKSFKINLFDKFDKVIEFQNSTDPDYDYSIFDNLSTEINNLIAKAKIIPIEELKNKYYYDIKNTNIDYYRRTYVYDKVFEDILKVQDWLYNGYIKDDNIYI